MIDIIGLLSSDGYVMCNKTLIRLFGTDCAVLVGELCSEYRYHEARGELLGGMFYSTHETIEENTGINAHFQRKAFGVLTKAGIISIVKLGMPARNYFRISYEKLVEIFTTDSAQNSQQDMNDVDDKSCTRSTTSRARGERQDVHEVNVNNNKYNNNKNNNKNNNVCSADDEQQGTKNRKTYPTEFEELWKLYPRKIDKGNAYKSYLARKKNGWSDDDLKAAIEEYARQCRKNHTEEKFIKHMTSFFSATEPFADYLNKGEEDNGFDPDDPFAGFI